VDDVRCREPAALCGTDAEADEVQVRGGVRVTVDGELHPETAGREDVLVAQVNPVRQAVHLQCGAGAGGRAEHLVPVRVDAGPMPQHPRGRVADHVDVRVLAGTHQT